MDQRPDDLFEFAQDDQPPSVEPGCSFRRGWKILVIDDDEDVHQSTLFALKGLTLLGRELQFLHAYSATDARPVLLDNKDLALVFLDVVMETPDAGLALIEFLRQEAKLTSTRVILRTGQPGYAPEHETMVRYDINDYKTKSELTHHKLLTTVTAALRAYDQLQIIEANRQGLELIISCSSGFLDASDIHYFAAGVITQVAALLKAEPDGLVCAEQGSANQGYTVLAAAGRFAACISQPLEQLQDLRIRHLLAHALKNGQSVFEARETVLFFGETGAWSMAAYIATYEPLKVEDQQLLNVFGVNLSAALRNYGLLELLRRDAYVDSLLMIPNRTSLVEHLNQSLGLEANQKVLALVDLDDFAGVNDLMGHAYADELLRATAQQLRRHFGAEVFMARVSSNTFGLLGDAQVLTHEQLRCALRQGVKVAGQPHLMSVTTGMAPYASYFSSGLDWLKNASITLKYAKRHRRGQVATYCDDMTSLSRSRAKLLEGLHKSFDQGQLFTVYQPQIHLGTGDLIGFEALVRWRGDDGQMIAPDQFIPVAEQSGLILALGDWILDCACRDMARLKDRGLRHCHMAVNVSVVQFQSEGFLQRVLGILNRNHLAPEDLELEITESVAMLGRNVVEDVLNELQAHGIAVAIDDFGTGYSSLSYLKQLPADRLKIDRAFVAQLAASDGSGIAAMITELGHKLGMKVLAEGIEDAQTWQALHALGCDEGQGYFIARPLQFDALCDWIAGWPGQKKTLLP